VYESGHRPHTRAFTQSINFQKRNVETEKELQSIFLDRCCRYYTVGATVETKRLTNRLKDQVISQRPTIRNDSTTMPNTMTTLAFLLRSANVKTSRMSHFSENEILSSYVRA